MSLTAVNVAGLMERGWPEDHILYLIRQRLHWTGNAKLIPAAEQEAREEIKKLREATHDVS